MPARKQARRLPDERQTGIGGLSEGSSQGAEILPNDLHRVRHETHDGAVFCARKRLPALEGKPRVSLWCFAFVCCFALFKRRRGCVTERLDQTSCHAQQRHNIRERLDESPSRGALSRANEQTELITSPVL
ncbi:hypothetical protein TgHK011_001041 [Trichoderma gracile]|nr:hypothetical protein TgHK011_001041 [Trichoderma gracile]